MKKLFFVVLCLFFLGGCALKTVYVNYVYNDWGGESLKKAVDGLVVIETVTIVEWGEKERVEDIDKAIAIPIGNGEIVALAHATSQIPVPEAIDGKPTRVSKRYYIDEEEIKFVGDREDIALFVSTDKTRKFPYPFGDDSKLKIGDKVVSIGFPAAILINVKDGIVSRLNVGNKYMPALRDCLITDIKLDGGDSGSPLLAKNSKGELEIVGISCAYWITAKSINFHYKINYVKETLDYIRNNSDK